MRLSAGEQSSGTGVNVAVLRAVEPSRFARFCLHQRLICAFGSAEHLLEIRADGGHLLGEEEVIDLHDTLAPPGRDVVI